MKDSNFQRAMNYLKIHGLIKYNKDVATAVGVTEATISRAVKRGISADLAMSFNATYGNMFNIDWLINGNGEMLAKEESTNAINNSNVITGGTNTTMKERILRLQEEKGIKNATFERMIGVANGYLKGVKNPSNQKLDKILRAFPDINREWLYFGYGEMYSRNTPPAISNIINGGTNTNVNMTISGHTETQVEEAEVVEDFETAPVIPSVWAKRTNFDIVEAIEERGGELEKSRVAVAGTQIDAWHIMTDNSMYPYFYKGDKVALAIAPTKKIMPGCMYGLDTIPHGLIIRTLFETENGYRAHAFNSEDYPDFIIAEEDVQNILRVICSFRI